MEGTMKPEVPVIDRNVVEELPVAGPFVTIERNQRLPANEFYDGAMRATIITGFDTQGQVIEERGLLERHGLGKLRQFVTEKWKVARVKRAVAKTVVLDTVPSV
jgi:hypothetical protein